MAPACPAGLVNSLASLPRQAAAAPLAASDSPGASGTTSRPRRRSSCHRQHDPTASGPPKTAFNCTHACRVRLGSIIHHRPTLPKAPQTRCEATADAAGGAASRCDGHRKGLRRRRFTPTGVTPHRRPGRGLDTRRRPSADQGCAARRETHVAPRIPCRRAASRRGGGMRVLADFLLARHRRISRGTRFRLAQAPDNGDLPVRHGPATRRRSHPGPRRTVRLVGARKHPHGPVRSSGRRAERGLGLRAIGGKPGRQGPRCRRTVPTRRPFRSRPSGPACGFDPAGPVEAATARPSRTRWRSPVS